MTRRTGLRNGRFGHTRVDPGDVAQVNLKISETATHKAARLPITVMRGTKPGPTMFVTGAVHGDEINGVAIVRRLLDVLETDNLAGTLIGVPVVNRFGFGSQERYLPDRRDLNRFFPGDPTGSMAARICDTIFKKVIMISDAGIDLHTAAAGQENLCHVRGDADDPTIRDMMRAFGTPIALHGAGPKGSLRRAATEAGVPTVIYEAGEPSRFQHHAIEIGFNGVLRTMKHMGMTNRRTRVSDLQIVVRKSEWLRSDHGGLLDILVEPGDLVRTGQRVAVIHDPFGRHVDEITSPRSGVVLSRATVPLCHPGNAIIHIGHLAKTLASARKYVKAGGDLGHIHWVEANRPGVRKAARKAAKKKADVSAAKKAAKKAAPKPGKKSIHKSTGKILRDATDPSDEPEPGAEP